MLKMLTAKSAFFLIKLLDRSSAGIT